MANYAPNQFDDAEMAQFQDEFRRRQHQSLQAGSALTNPAMALSAGRVRPPDAYFIPHHPDVANPQVNSPFYSHNGVSGQPHHASPYARVNNPYAAMDAAHAYAQGHTGLTGTPQTGSSDAVAQLYAAQQRRAQVTGTYGYNGGLPASRAALEQHYTNYGMTGVQSAGMYYGHEGAYQTQSHDAASMHQQQQQHHHHQMQDAYSRIAPKNITSAPYQSPIEGESGRDDNKFESPDDSTSMLKAPKSPKSKEGKTKHRMLQKVTTTYTNMKTNARVTVKDGITVIEDGDDIWYTGCVPLGVEDDKYWLSELQVYLRSNFAEAFGATEEDIAAPMHGRNKPIALGQVGIRCVHCKQENPAERGQQATSYPSLISGIYNSVQQMLRLHLDCCLSMPADVRAKIEALKVSCSSRGGRKQYWVDSAKRLGLVDTPHGIHFGRDPLGPLPPLSGPSVNSKEGRIKKKNPPKPPPAPKSDPEPESEENLPPPPPVDSRPLVFPEDEDLISDYLYLTLQQMAPCFLMEADRVGCYKTRKVGFPGLACRHCVGQAGCGRYFPASEASLSQTTTSQTIMNHVRNCRRCPIEIRENLEIMKRSRMGPDGKRSEKPKHGGRKVFFHRLWCRIQNIPFDDDIAELKEKKKKKLKKSGSKKKTTDTGDEVESDEEESEDEETDSMEDESDAEEEDIESKPKAKKGSSNSTPKKKFPAWVPGCVRLSKSDDPHWLSEMECFARSDLVEVFTVKEEDIQEYMGRHKPAVGQVGVRCTFCKKLDASERASNCVYFPDSLSSLHTKVTDMFRLHCPNCPSMPTQTKVMVKSFKGFDAKVMNDDSQQYWVDSARDIGLSNVPPEGPDVPGAWGITFRRDPIEPSPADELDLEQANGTPVDLGLNSLVREEDWGTCTDQMMLLLRQFRPCCFKKSDRRAGPGSRGRDRAIGYPGLCCVHCAGRNSLGRHFPINAKNLMDSTIASLQTHISTCVHAPEPIKASLAYLSHRTILQRAELSGSWKKTYFQKIWDRLHEHREWTSIDDDMPDHPDDEESVEEEDLPEDDDDEDGGDDDDEEDEEKEDDEGDAESGNPQMNALIKAAAIWLTNQDAATDGKGATRSAKGRPLPGKRNASAAAIDVEHETKSHKDGGSKKRKGRK